MAVPPGVSYLPQPFPSGAAALDAPEGSQAGQRGPDPIGAGGGRQLWALLWSMLGPGFGAEAEERCCFPPASPSPRWR